MNLLILCIATIVLKDNYAVLSQLIRDCETPSVLNETLRVDVRFRLADIVPQIIPSPPPYLLGVRWPVAFADLGNCISPVQTILPPILIFQEADPKNFYTLIIVDGDSPSPVAPVLNYGLIALYVNIKGDELVSAYVNVNRQRYGFPPAPYLSPATEPGSGSHRIVALVYRQEKEININNLGLLRLGAIFRGPFDLDGFLNDYPIGELVAGNYWLASISECRCSNVVNDYYNYDNYNNCNDCNNNNYNNNNYNEISRSVI